MVVCLFKMEILLFVAIISTKRFGSQLSEINLLHKESFVISLTNLSSKCLMAKFGQTNTQQ